MVWLVLWLLWMCVSNVLHVAKHSNKLSWILLWGLLQQWSRYPVFHKSEFCRSRWSNRAGFWHGSFLSPILCCVKRKFGYLQKKGTSLWNFVPNSGLRKICFGISIVETCYRNSLLRASKLTVTSKLQQSTTVWFITVIIKLCLQHNSIVHVD